MNKSIFDIYEFVTQVSNLKDVVSNWCYFFLLSSCDNCDDLFLSF